MGKYQPGSSTSSYSKQKKFRQSYKQAQHTYSPQTGKDNSFLFKRGRHLHNIVGHEEVSQEARKSQTMMDQSCVSVNLRVLKNKPKNFQAGKISQYYENWLKLTSDKSLLDIVKNGYDIVF